jgi:hypothetical protein
MKKIGEENIEKEKIEEEKVEMINIQWLISGETEYFFDFFLIHDRLGLIFIPHILRNNRETATLPRLREWTYRTIFVKNFVLKIFYKGLFLCVIPCSITLIKVLLRLRYHSLVLVILYFHNFAQTRAHRYCS